MFIGCLLLSVSVRIFGAVERAAATILAQHLIVFRVLHANCMAKWNARVHNCASLKRIL